jgi:hypothetical protein
MAAILLFSGALLCLVVWTCLVDAEHAKEAAPKASSQGDAAAAEPPAVAS